jgi:hypothetical protein
MTVGHQNCIRVPAEKGGEVRAPSHLQTAERTHSTRGDEPGGSCASLACHA